MPLRSVDILANKEYNYIYEQGRIVRATEARVSLNDNGFAVSKDIVNTIRYAYDGEGQLTKKTIISASGDTAVVHIDNADGNTIVKFNDGQHNVTSHSKSDSFGRKIFDEVQFGTGFVSRQFTYHIGEVTEEHTSAEKLKSSPTTHLVSRIILSDGRTLSYEYDAEERITKVIDSVDGITEYTYDALGQLLTETVNGVVVNEMTYDNYGNILTKNGKAYNYGDPVWKDILVIIY